MKLSRKYVVLASLYIVQSVPFSFIKTGFQLLLKEDNIDYKSLGAIMSLLLLPWVFKFVWAPLVDKWCANSFPKIRKAILFFQVLGAALLGLTASFQFPEAIQPVLGAFFLFSLVAATQDIIIDAFAVLALPKKEHGIGNTFQMGGYYVGEVLGGALILIIFDRFGWNWAMMAFVLFFLIPFIPVLLYKHDETIHPPKPSTAGFSNVKSYFKMQGMGFWLLVMVIYMANQMLASTLLPSMFLDMGYTKTEIASIVSIWGNTASVAGAVLAGVLVEKWGRKNCLVGFGSLKILSLLGFFLLKGDADTTIVYSVIMVNGFISGLATVTVFTIMMDKCRLTSPGTDFTIQQSINLFAIATFGALSGRLVKADGDFTVLFITAFIVGLVGVLLAAFGLSSKSLDNGNGLKAS
eukprot:gene32196-42983_t